jgi:predicted PurR-regulated permease PerM
MKQELSFTRRVVITTAIVLLLGGAFALVLYAVHFFFLIFASILFAVFLRAIANWLHDKTGMAKGIALAIAALLFFGTLFLTGWLIAPTVQAQVEDLRETLPSSIERLKDQLGRTSWGAKAVEEFEDSQENMMPETQEIVNKAQAFFASTISILTDIFIVIVIGIFFAANPAQYQRGVVSLVPLRHRTRLWEVLDKSYETLKWWLLGKLVTMVFVGIATAIGLMLLGIPMMLALAVIAFFLDFIPTIGPIIASIPAILIAFLDGPMTALYVAILYFIIQSIESYLLAPLIFEKTVHISPVLTLLSLVLFGILVGPLGVILAAPLVAVLQVFVRELYIKDYLERDLPINQKS